MSKMYRVLALGMAMALIFGVPTFVMAINLTAPTGVSCENDGATVSANWDDLAGAVKYSAEFLVSYDTDGNTSTVEATLTFDKSTFTSDVSVALSDFAADTNLDTLPDTIVSVVVRVKGLAPGKNQSSQNNPFSGLVDCGPIGPPPVPDNFYVVSTSSTSVTIYWDDTPNETYYEIGWGPGFIATTFTVPADTTSYPFSGLAPFVSWHFNIRACNLAGCSAWHGDIGCTPGGGCP